MKVDGVKIPKHLQHLSVENLRSLIYIFRDRS